MREYIAPTSLEKTVTSKVASTCVAPTRARPWGWQSSLLMVMTWSYGNWIDKSRHSGTRLSGQY